MWSNYVPYHSWFSMFPRTFCDILGKHLVLSKLYSFPNVFSVFFSWNSNIRLRGVRGFVFFIQYNYRIFRVLLEWCFFGLEIWKSLVCLQENLILTGLLIRKVMTFLHLLLRRYLPLWKKCWKCYRLRGKVFYQCVKFLHCISIYHAKQCWHGMVAF